MKLKSRIRRSPLPRISVDPSRVVDMCPTETRPVPSSLPIVVNDALHPQLLLGRPRFAWHRLHAGSQSISAVVVRALDPQSQALIASLEDATAQIKPSQRACAVRALRDGGMGLSQIAQHVPDLGSLTAASRWAALADADPYLLEMLDRGTLQFCHASVLIPMNHPDQRRWAERCVAGRWSYAHLRKSLASHGDGLGLNSQDSDRYARSLGEALGADVALKMHHGKSSMELRVRWFNVEELQGVMARLGDAPPPCVLLPARPRYLSFDIDSLDELEQLASHVLGDAF